MAKKLIVLYGPENKGKTETLNRLIKILLLDGGKIELAETHTSNPEAIDIKISGDKTQVLIPQNIEDFHNTFWDKKVVIGYREKRIAIATKGDGNKEIEQSVDFFKEEAEKGCDIFITAIRTNKTDISEESLYKQLIKGLKDLNLEPELIQKQLHSNVNQTQAEEIKAFIDKICN